MARGHLPLWLPPTDQTPKRLIEGRIISMKTPFNIRLKSLNETVTSQGCSRRSIILLNNLDATLRKLTLHLTSPLPSDMATNITHYTSSQDPTAANEALQPCQACQPSTYYHSPPRSLSSNRLYEEEREWLATSTLPYRIVPYIVSTVHGTYREQG